MTALIALIRKDLILFLADRRALLLNLVMPILLGAFFGFVTGGRDTKEAAKIEIAVVSQDDHVISQKILKGLKEESTLLVKEMPLEEAKALVLKGKLNMAVLIPEKFGECAGGALFGGREKPELDIFYDPSQTAVLAMVKGMLTQQVMQSVSAEMFGGKSGTTFIDQSLQDLEKMDEANKTKGELHDLLGSVKKFQLSQQADKDANAASAASSSASAANAGLSMPFVTKDQAMTAGDPVTNKYNGYAHSFAGMSVQFILFMAIDAGIGILLARRMGLWSRLLAAPVGLNTVLIARALSCALIACFLMCFIFLVAVFVFNVHIAGSLPGFVGVVISFSLMTASFGLLIAAFGKTPEAARGISVFATLIMVMLSGAWMPSFMFPQWLQNLTLIVPTRWAVDGLDAMTWRGLGLEAALPAVGVQLAFAAVFGVIALWRFRKA
ncbi:MAG: ABC-2 transporter permease [Burkholderiales bacterium]|nr:ABC-2 transporter permease [Burkholderiales bacterium]MBI3730713.1 ABC-2 transporter permease [Burkholderiales bacterium]